MADSPTTSAARPTLADAIATTLCTFDCGGDGTGTPCLACHDTVTTAGAVKSVYGRRRVEGPSPPAVPFFLRLPQPDIVDVAAANPAVGKHVDGVALMNALAGSSAAGHSWIRTVPTDGRWCERCGIAEAQWSGDPCSGVVATVENAIDEGYWEVRYAGPG